MKSYTVRIQGEIFPVDQPGAANAAEVAARIVECMKYYAAGGRAEPIYENVFDFYLDVDDAASPIDAVLSGADSLRTAAHHANVSTAGWPEAKEWDSYLDERAVEAIEKAEHSGTAQELIGA